MIFFSKKLSHLTDEELMERVHQGSEAALTELYQRYGAPLMRYFARMLWNDQQKAQDFLQDVFIKIIDQPSRYDTRRKFSTWLYSVAHNMCKNEYRRKTNQDRFNGFQYNDRDETDLNEHLDKETFKNKLGAVLDNLDEEDKTILLLKYDEELSIEQISEIVLLTEGTVKSRLFYLRKKLAKKLNAFRIIFNEREI